MRIEFIIAGWLLERLKNENLIDDAIDDGVRKRFLRNVAENSSNSELKDKVA